MSYTKADKSAELRYEWEVEQRLTRRAEAQRKIADKPASDKQMAFFLSLAKGRTTTKVGKNGDSWQEAIDRVLGKIQADANYRPRNAWISTAIDALKGEESARR